MSVDYGRDISCTTSLRTGRFASGVRLVAEAAFRRLTTPRGMLRGGDHEADYGFDLTEVIGSVQTKQDEAALPGRIQSELLKDERIESVNVTVVRTIVGPATVFDVTIEAQSGAGPFTLVLRASEVTVELLDIKAAA